MHTPQNPYTPPQTEAFVPEEQGPPVDYGSQQAAKHIRAARIALMIVGVLSIGVDIYYTVQVHGEMQKYGITLAQLPALSIILLGLGYAVAVTYIVLSFVARTRPFGAALTGLILYIADILVGALDDPSMLYRGLLIKIIIIVVLIRAVRAGAEYRRYRALAAPGS